MKQVLLVLMMLCQASLFSQDTLFWRNGKTELIRLEEIQAEDIRYYLFEHPEGPIYVTQKREIRALSVRQKQDTGYTKFVFIAEGPQTPPPDHPAQLTAMSYPHLKPLSIIGKRIYQGRMEIRDDEMAVLLEEYPNPSVREELGQLNKKMKINRKLSNVMLYCAIPAAALSVQGLFMGALFNDPATMIVFGAGGLVLTGCFVSMKIYCGNKAKAYRTELVERYNNPLFEP